jgi:transposase
MGTGIRYSDEFKQEAVNQVVIHGYDATEVSKRLGISTKSLYKWKKELAKPVKKRQEEHDLQAEIARLKRELKRTKQERDIIKEAAVFFASESKNATRS